MRRQIVGIRFDGLLGVGLPVTQTAALAVQIGQLLGQQRGVGIGLDGGLVVLDREIHVVVATGGVSSQLGVHVTHGVAVVGSGPIGTRDRRISLPPARSHAQQQDQEDCVQ